MKTSFLDRSLQRAGQPLLLAGALGLWLALGASAKAVPISILAILVSLFALELRNPRRRDWRQSWRERTALFAAWIALAGLLGSITVVYEVWLEAVIPERPDRLQWPGELPWWIQALLLFFLADGVYYWIHRAIHRWGWLWRASGHGVHHAFHNLHAVNAGVTHPFEILLIALPLALLGALLAVPPEATAAGTVMLGANAQIVHANLELGCPGLRWLVTTGADHRLHHSIRREHADRNFACNAIVWDRLFGTHAHGEVARTGSGPRQPDALELATLPFRKPRR